MSYKVLIIGESGSGKSTSIKTLPAEETFIINCIGKDLPFKGWRSKYKPYSKDNPSGNIYSTVKTSTILLLLNKIKEMPHIKNVVIDDFQYTMSDEFMERAKEKGFEKFTEIGQNAYKIIKEAGNLREDQIVFILSHSEEIMVENAYKIKMKTIGKMLDEKITPEGLFTIVLISRASRSDEGTQYYFETNSIGFSSAKSPEGMFPLRIPNDLNYVVEQIHNYNKE